LPEARGKTISSCGWHFCCFADKEEIDGGFFEKVLIKDEKIRKL